MENENKEVIKNILTKIIIIYIILFLLMLIVSGIFITSGSKSIFIMIFIGLYLGLGYYSYTEYKKLSIKENNQEKFLDIKDYQTIKDIIKNLPFSLAASLYQKEINYEDFVTSVLYSLKQKGVIKIEYDAIVLPTSNIPLENNEIFLLNNIEKVYSSITIRSEWKLKLYNDLVKKGIARFKNIKNRSYISFVFPTILTILIELLISLIFKNNFATSVLIPSFIFTIVLLIICRKLKDYDDNTTLEIIRLNDIELLDNGINTHNLLISLNYYLKRISTEELNGLLRSYPELIPYTILFNFKDNLVAAECNELKELSLNKKKYDKRGF